MSSPPPRLSVTADHSLGGDRALTLQHLPQRFRPAFEALFMLDAAMGDVVARSTEPALGRIKLAWWREQLERLDSEAPPAEPRLRAVAEHLLPLGISGAQLAELETGWATLLDAEIDPELVADRGTLLFKLGGRILELEDEKLGDAGAFYALASVARRGVPELFEAAAARAEKLKGHRFPRPLRSLTGLARLAARDLDRHITPEPEASAARAAAMLRHRWSGIVTRAD
jgi:15-cis-phytoene synthase